MNRKNIAEINETDFDLHVLQSKEPVLVAFLAHWSQPCQKINFMLDEVATACAGRVKVVKVNADNNPDLGLWYDIQSIPTLLYFADGNLRGKIVGIVSTETILSKLESAFAVMNPHKFNQA